MPWWSDYKRTRPRDVQGGVKARSRRGQIGQTWWAQRWSQALASIMDAGRLSRGRSYARRGQVLNIDEEGQLISARVQGSQQTPYKVEILIQSISDDAWEQVLDVLADQAIFTAQLLAGEMPADIEDVFSAAGTSLFPISTRELETQCSCPDWANPCKHIAAVYFLLGEAFDNDPFMLFRLRGRTQEQILKGLRERRTSRDEEEDAEYDGLAAIHTVDSALTPLPDTINEFWSLGRPLDDFEVQPCAPEVQLSLLQRLGEPPFLPANTTLRMALGSNYQAVTEHAESVAFDD
jgi:uncharacterized Zn finger protein